MSTEPTAAEILTRDVLRVHHPIMRSETGPFSGCRCGQVRLGQDVIAHVVGHLAAALAAAREEGRQEVRAAVEKVADDLEREAHEWTDGERACQVAAEVLRAAVAPAQPADDQR